MIDAVITELELQLESNYSPYGHFVCFRFIDTYPMFPKINKTINEITKFDDIKVIDVNHTFEQITENTDLKGLEFTKH